MVIVDWGSTRVRGYLVREGVVSASDQSAAGAKELGGDTAAYQAEMTRLLEVLGADAGSPIRISGMAGSKNGWVEVPYVDTPVVAAGFRGNVMSIEGYPDLQIYGGLRHHDADGRMDVMRGEEMQIFGLMHLKPDSRLVCLPGTHSKWARVNDGVISEFRTHMTGDLFQALLEGTIFSEQVGGREFHESGFLRGSALALDGNGLDDLFRLRTEYLNGSVGPESFFSCLSGFLIGNEIRAVGATEQVCLCGGPELTRLYALVLEQASIESVEVDAEEATTRGHLELFQG